MEPSRRPLVDTPGGGPANSSTHSASQKRKRLLVLAAWIALLASMYPLLAHSTHVGSADAHGTIEWVGAIFGVVAGFALITRFYVLGSPLYLFVGLAFFVNGAEDFVHGLLSLAGEHHWLGAGEASLARFIPGTYVAGRLVFGTLLFLAPFAQRLLGSSRNPKRVTIWTSTSVLLGAAAATGAAFAMPLPRFIYPDSIISRPVDFASAGVLLAALIVFLRQYRRDGDAFCWWILLSIGANVVGQLMMSFSRSLFDAFFDIAHVYKLTGYVVPLLGFCLYQITVIRDRQRAHEELARHREHLEELVEARTSALRESEERLRITLTSIGDGVITTDTGEQVTHLNQAAEALTGWTFQQARGRPLDEIFRIINEETRQPAKNPVTAALATGQVEGLANHTVLIARDGTERAIADSAAPIQDASGRTHGVVLVFRDVTEERQHQREREELLRSLKERVKELSCLYGLSSIIEKPAITLEEILREAAGLLPASWRYPEIACGRVRYEGQLFQTEDCPPGRWRQSADIEVDGRKAGSVEVCYREPRPEADEGPFLTEERALIDAVAERLGRIIDRLEMQRSLAESESKYRTLLESLPQKIFLKDRDSIYVSCNENYARDLGIAPKEIAGKTDHDFHPKELVDKYRADDRRIIESGETETIEERFVQDGIESVVQTVKTPVKDENGAVAGVLGIFWDITDRKRAETELQEANRRLKEMTNTDVLTGLRNRRHLFEVLEQELRRIQRYGGQVALAMFDVDHFKTINDIYGHQVGDDVLVEVAARLQTGARTTDAVIRLSGDEFVVLMPNATLEAAAEAAERTRKLVGQDGISNGERALPVTVSAGISAARAKDGSTAESLLRQADQALYDAKRAGRNRVVAEGLQSTAPARDAS